jgi:hypothetical protein
MTDREDKPAPLIVTAEADPPTQGPPSALDIIEQQERINNLEIDTALKLQTIKIAKAQLFIALATVLVALGGVVIGGLTLYLDHREASEPHNTFIFSTPQPKYNVIGG